MKVFTILALTVACLVAFLSSGRGEESFEADGTENEDYDNDK